MTMNVKDIKNLSDLANAVGDLQILGMTCGLCKDEFVFFVKRGEHSTKKVNEDFNTQPLTEIRHFFNVNQIIPVCKNCTRGEKGVKEGFTERVEI